MDLKPTFICQLGFITCFILEFGGLLLLLYNGPCEPAAALSHSVSVTSVLFVLLLDMVCASLIMKCESVDAIDPAAIIVNMWSTVVCTGAGVSIGFLALYRCGNPTHIIFLSAFLLLLAGLLHVVNAIYSFTKASS